MKRYRLIGYERGALHSLEGVSQPGIVRGRSYPSVSGLRVPIRRVLPYDPGFSSYRLRASPDQGHQNFSRTDPRLGQFPRPGQAYIKKPAG
jgi:hypothetical protein